MAMHVPSGTVDIPEIEIEDEVRLPVDETAVIVVDMQNDFVKPDGNLVVEDASKTISNIQHLLEAAREVGVHVAYTQDTAVEDDPEFDIWPEHCVRGTWGREFVTELEPEPDDLICPKNRYDGFYGTWLDHFLTRIWKVKNVVIVGTVANICVLHTAASAGLRWINVVMPADGISALNPFDQAMTLRQVSWLYAGQVVRSTKDITFEA